MAILTCVRCGRRARRRVVYGYPGPELIELAKAGKVVLGGCCLPPTPIENWLCDRCRSADDAQPAREPAQDRSARGGPGSGTSSVPDNERRHPR